MSDKGEKTYEFCRQAKENLFFYPCCRGGIFNLKYGFFVCNREYMHSFVGPQSISFGRNYINRSDIGIAFRGLYYFFDCGSPTPVQKLVACCILRKTPKSQTKSFSGCVLLSYGNSDVACGRGNFTRTACCGFWKINCSCASVVEKYFWGEK